MEARGRRYWVCRAAALCLVGCNPFAMVQGTQQADKAVLAFHDSLNEGHFAQIYDGASEEFRGATKSEKFAELLEAVHRKLGKVRSSKSQGWRANSWNMKTFVESRYETQFEQGSAQETFRFQIKDGQAFLIAYNINSNDLI